MKRIVSALAAFSLLFACTPEENNPSSDNENNGKDNGGDKEVVATAIKLNKNELTLEKGANETLTVTFMPSNTTDKSLTWGSSNKSVAGVTDGIVVGVDAGSTEIIVKHGDLTDKCTVTVVISAKGISLNKTSLEFKALNQTETLTATVDPASTTDKLEWTSSNISVASVADGVVTSVAPGTAEITVTCGSVSAKCSVSVEIIATSVSLSKNNLSLTVGDSETLTATVEPANTTDKLEWSSSDTSIATVEDGVVTAVAKGTATITATAGTQTATCGVVIKEPFSITQVELGLSVKWANANLGADKEEGYGDYYAWGETETKDNYSWSTYQFGTSSSGPFSKYNTSSSYGTVDNKTVLDPEDDVAYVKLGGSWRMPTDAEWTELRENCSWTWTTQNGVSGRLVTSKTNGNSIFLPAAGCRNSTSLDYAGSDGIYWSSTLYTGGPSSAWDVGFNSDDVSSYGSYRYYGFSVRPVTE